MSEERIEAIVIRGVDFSESSRVITLITPHRGKVAVLAKGARRMKNGTGSVLDTLNHIDAQLYWKDNRNVQNLGEVSIISAYPGVKQNLDKACFAALPAELVGLLAGENAPSEDLFDAFVRGVASMEAFNGDVRTHGAWQVYRLLIAAGYKPSLDNCGECGKPNPRAAGFRYSSGAVCADCESDVPLTQKLRAQFASFAAAQDRCPEFQLDIGGLEMICAYASYHVERDLRSLRVIRQMYQTEAAL